MSCETGRNRISSRAAVAAGLSGVSSKFGNTAGLLVGRATRTADQVGQTIAPATSLAMNVLEPTGVRNRRKQVAAKQMLTGTAAALALAGRATGLIKLLTVLSQVKRVGIMSERLTGAVGTGAARLSETGLAGAVAGEKRFLFFFKSKTSTRLWKSSLTPLLNRREIIGSRPMSANRGAMFRARGKTWHRGTVSFQVGPQKRTITHLQGLSYPGEHYYFDRSVSNARAVGIASGKIQPQTVPGYVGQISKSESLCPAWAGAKRALLLARLHWSPAKGSKRGN